MALSADAPYWGKPQLPVVLSGNLRKKQMKFDFWGVLELFAKKKPGFDCMQGRVACM
ncbi:hypothetical protein [Undibacterium crateris]|uniref:hypothetical protein n=1 Tax=Undibacterium crateris TaxID=2528175 RepID=UPI001389F575|nr:hypothetical protein [Undibacterium crateris]NDI84002.1 hypothetical protein [Undibacterium crateris]